MFIPLISQMCVRWEREWKHNGKGPVGGANCPNINGATYFISS